MATARDRVWAAALRVGLETDEFRVRDVLDQLGEEAPSRKTVQRTLRGMTETGVLAHVPSSPWYSCVWSKTDEPEPAPEPARPEKSLEEIVADLEPPGYSDELQERRRDAVRQAVAALQEHGELSKLELLEQLDGPAGYDDGQSLWQNWLYDALKTLEEHEFVVSPGRTSRGWRLQG